MVAGMRLALAASALLIIYIDPAEPDRFVLLTYLVLVLYTLYSASLLYLQTRQGHLTKAVSRWSHWADVAWYLLLISLSSGTNSIFFFFFFFCILVASFRWGLVAGLRVTFVSSVSFSLVGYFASPPAPDFELNKFLLRPVYLCLLGYMMAHLGDYEIALRRRLALLKEVATISNPRFGIQRTLGVIMSQLRAFYDADACLFLLRDEAAGAYRLLHAKRSEGGAGLTEKPLDEVHARHLLAVPDACALSYGAARDFLGRERQAYFAYDLIRNEPEQSGRNAAAELADMLDAFSFASAPLLTRSQLLGRIFLIRKAGRSFNHGDVVFLAQVVEQISPVIENIMLVDRMASGAAEEERKRIARDIHDSIIQPYIGLQIGLATLEGRLARSEDCESYTDIRSQVARLIGMTEEGVRYLRGYVRGLTEEHTQGDILVVSLRNFAEKFRGATGIEVAVEAQDVQVNDRLAAEIFQLVAEGLSNVRRHTQSAWAAVRLTQEGEAVVVRVENESPESCSGFTPRSISLRAGSLGGRIRVETAHNRTCVIIEIPL